VAAVNGVATFNKPLSHRGDDAHDSFRQHGLMGATSAAVVVSPAPAARLTIQTQPSSTAQRVRRSFSNRGSELKISSAICAAATTQPP